MSWKEDLALSSQLEIYVKQNFRKAEILDFINRDYGFHFESGLCCMRTLTRMLQHFDIKYIDYSTAGSDITDAVQKELLGAGKNLGYRAMHSKLRQKYGLKVPRHVVYDVMTNLDHDGLIKRRLGSKKKKRDRQFTTMGINSFFSIDGHDKMMGYQNSTFPLAIYGILDQASRKIMMLKCWTTNSDPNVIGKWYMELLETTRVLPRNIRLDCGTETGKLVTLHAYLRSSIGDLEEPLDSVFYGPSTSNQIERWWRELHERLEKSIKKYILELLHENKYNPHDQLDRKILAFIMIPIVQRELNEFKDVVWNNHRIRAQKESLLPNGIPTHIYEFPEKYNLQDCGYLLSRAELEDVKQAANLPPIVDFLSCDERDQFESHIPHPAEIPIKHIKTAYNLLKERVNVV